RAACRGWIRMKADLGDGIAAAEEDPTMKRIMRGRAPVPDGPEDKERVQRALEELRADYRARRRVHPLRILLTVGLVALFRPGRFLYPCRWQQWADLALHACAASDSAWGVRALLRMGTGADSGESY